MSSKIIKVKMKNDREYYVLENTFIKGFIPLDDEKEKEFRQWARENISELKEVSHRNISLVKDIYHPAVQDELIKILKLIPIPLQEEIVEDLSKVSDKITSLIGELVLIAKKDGDRGAQYFGAILHILNSVNSSEDSPIIKWINDLKKEYC